MTERPKTLPEAEMVHANVYRIHSRNLIVGVWDAPARGFIGIREKFGEQYLFTEYHRETGPPFGTAVALRHLGVMPPDIPVKERLDGNQPNPALFALLETYEGPIWEERRLEDERWEAEAASLKWRPQTEREAFLEERQAEVRTWMREQREKGEMPWREISKGMTDRIRENQAEATKRFGPDR